jgi:hypothetical protein
MLPKNQLTIEECKLAYPKKSWFQPDKSKTMKAEIPEKALQTYANDAITLRRWSYIRFSSALMGWLKRNAPEWVQRAFFVNVGGKLPDNLILAQVAPGIFLGVKLELKTQDKQGRAVGKLHGKQRRYAEAEGWYIARSPEQINAVLDDIEKKVEATKKNLAFK